jgi:hypothetical protein
MPVLINQLHSFDEHADYGDGSDGMGMRQSGMGMGMGHSDGGSGEMMNKKISLKQTDAYKKKQMARELQLTLNLRNVQGGSSGGTLAKKASTYDMKSHKLSQNSKTVGVLPSLGGVMMMAAAVAAVG